MTLAAVAALAVAAALDWYAAYRGMRRTGRVTRPLVTAALAALAVALNMDGGQASGFSGSASVPVQVFLYLSLALALASEVLRPLTSTAAFVASMVSSMVSVLFMAVSLRLLGPLSVPAQLAAAVAVAAVFFNAGRRIGSAAVAEGGSGLAVAITMFAALVGTLWVSAVGTVRPLVAAGALLVLVAYLVVGAHRFLGARANARLVVAVTSQVGMAMIIWGALR